MLVAFIATAITLWIWYIVANESGPLLVPAIGLGILAVMKWPDIVVVTAVFLLNFKVNEIHPALAPAAILSIYLAALAILAVIIRIFTAPPRRLELHAAPVLLLVLWALLTLGVPVARDRSLAFEAWQEYSKVLLLVCAVVTFIRTERQIQALARMCVIGGVIVALSAIVTYWLGIDLVEGTRAYAGSGALANPNDVALILLLPLSLTSVAALSSGSRLQRLSALFAGLVIGWGILVCQSRGAIFGMAALCAAIAYHRVKSKPMFLLVALLVLSAVGPALDFLERDADGTQSFDDESAQGRIFAWNAGIAMAKAYPLTGVGMGNFAAQYPDFTEAVTGLALTAHSIWFLILGEAGWPGLAVFIALVSVCVRDCKRAITAFGKIGSPTGVMLATGVFAGLISFLVCGSFVSVVYQWPLQVLFILTFTVSRATIAGQLKPGLPDEARLAPT